MEHDAAYDFGAAYARLTCVFEDAAGLALEGQSARATEQFRSDLIATLESLTQDAGAILKEIKTAMNR